MYTTDNEHFPSGGCCQKKPFLQCSKQNLALLRNLSDMGSTFKQFVGVMNLACYSLK